MGHQLIISNAFYITLKLSFQFCIRTILKISELEEKSSPSPRSRLLSSSALIKTARGPVQTFRLRRGGPQTPRALKFAH